jgi:hypothetical protein
VTSIKVYGLIMILSIDLSDSGTGSRILFTASYSLTDPVCEDIGFETIAHPSDRLEYPLLMSLRIPGWLSRLTRYGVLANELDPVGVFP